MSEGVIFENDRVTHRALRQILVTSARQQRWHFFDASKCHQLWPSLLDQKKDFLIICSNLARLTNEPSTCQMKQQELKPLIIQQWDQWVQTQAIEPGHASARDSFKFFLELEDAQSPLLNFQPRGRDKWQIVHDWLLNEGRVLN